MKHNIFSKKTLLILSIVFTNILTIKSCCQIEPYYLRVEAGNSFSSKARIHVDLNLWDPAIEGYENSLSHAPFFGLAAGYNFNPLFSMGANATFRSNFKYCKRQTPPSGNAVTPGFLETPKTRFFDFDNTSFMIELFVNRSGKHSCFAYKRCCFSINPFFGFGAGLSRNTVTNFHTKTDKLILTIPTFDIKKAASVMLPKTINRFGWQAIVGFDAFFCECFNLGLSYRFFHGGRFKSNDFVIDPASCLEEIKNIPVCGTLPSCQDATVVAETCPFRTPITAPAWCGTFKTHEIVASFSLNF